MPVPFIIMGFPAYLLSQYFRHCSSYLVNGMEWLVKTILLIIFLDRYVLFDRWMVGRSLRAVLLKVLYDQVVFSPISLTVYFGTVGLLEQSSCSELMSETWSKGCTIYKVEWIIWPPAQFLNFYVLPLRYRVFFDNLISFGFDVYTPYIKYRDHRGKAWKH